MNVQPFSISPNPNLLYLTSALRVTLEKVRFVLDERQGLTAILGDVGLGKSTVLRYLFNEYSTREDVVATLIPTPNFPSEFAFLKKICADFNLPMRRSMNDQQGTLQQFLLELYRDDKLCMVFIDEAQKLPGSQLELVRTLLNFETDETKLIQIVLSAQLELDIKLRDVSKKALRSRIFTYSMLAPLSPDEIREMVTFRCQQARVPNQLTQDALMALYTLSRGVPREALKIAAIAWKFTGGGKVTMQDIEDAASEILVVEEPVNA
jgi:general secretion pathway protein A